LRSLLANMISHFHKGLELGAYSLQISTAAYP